MSQQFLDMPNFFATGRQKNDKKLWHASVV